MAKQTLVIETAKELSVSGGMIVITNGETGEIFLRPIEDIGMIMIDHHSVRVSIPLMVRLAKNNVSIVYCNETHMPVSMTMDLDSNSMQSKRFQHQLNASATLKKRAWQQIVEAKILNQSLLLEKLGKGQKLLAQYYGNVKSGDSTNREGMAAKVYWRYLMGKGFIRDRYGEAQKIFDRSMLEDGFYHLHANMYVRYCTTGSNAAVHRERVKKMIPCKCCDISIIMSPDSQELNTYHSLNRKHTKKCVYDKPAMVEFF